MCVFKMKFLGIKFVPLDTPLKKHLETLAAGTMFVLLLGLLPMGFLLTVYLLFFTKYWAIVTMYLFWIWVIDKDISENGGRSSDWVRSWTLFQYVKNYYPVTLKVVPDFKMDPERNYITTSFPHGVMPIGAILAFQSSALSDSLKAFHKHIPHGLTLKCNFYIPLYREFLLAIGMCSTSPHSINWILSRPGGGRVIGLVVGGAAESFYSQQGEYRLILKNRKGFVKLALKNGTPIIPTFAFGQNNSFYHLKFADGSVIRRMQNWIKHLTGVAPIAVYGRGLLQNTFGFIPLQKPINIVVGTPVDTKKIHHPTQEDIDNLHAKFIDKLKALFEEYKYEYEEEPEKSKLIIA